MWEVFGITSRGEYHDLYAQSDTLLLADVFQNFRDKFNEIYELDDGSEHVKATGTKKCVIKSRLIFENYKDSLFNQKKYLKNNKDLKAIIMICTQIKLIRLP